MNTGFIFISRSIALNTDNKGAGWPSKTGGKSGRGRDNAPPRK